MNALFGFHGMIYLFFVGLCIFINSVFDVFSDHILLDSFCCFAPLLVFLEYMNTFWMTHANEFSYGNATCYIFEFTDDFLIFLSKNCEFSGYSRLSNSFLSAEESL